MKRRPLFLSTAKAPLATAFGGSWLLGAANVPTPGPGERRLPLRL
jgi:hypothetical protein